MKTSIHVIITGATGMVGEGVLHMCLLAPQVAKVLIINRRSTGIHHPKLTEILHADFMNVEALSEVVRGYDACFFCLGVSSVGMKEATYYQLTYELTIGFARLLSNQNSNMTFCYVSGSGTYHSENGCLMWARIKGKTERALLQLPFKSVYLFRPAIIIPIPGLQNTLKFYKFFGWLLPVLKVLWPNSICSLRAVGKAMIAAVINGYKSNILQVNDIKLIAATL